MHSKTMHSTRLNQWEVRKLEMASKFHGPRRSKAAKAKARKAKREATASGQPATTKIEDSSGPGTLNTGSSEPTILGNLEYKKRQQPRRFERFQRAEALGRYEAVAESGSDSDEDGRSEMDVDTGPGGTSDEEAPYAYSGTTRGSDAAEFAVGSRKQDIETMVENTMTELLARDVHMVEVSATDTADHGPTVTQEATSSLRPKFSHARKVTAKMNKKKRASSAGVGLQDGAIKGMQVSMANYMQRQTVVSTPSIPENSGDNSYERTECEGSIIPATPDSQEDLTMGEPHVGTAAGDCDLPVQLGQWLASFQGHEVQVATNGHCAFLAILASNINHSGPGMKNTPEVIRDATDLKCLISAANEDAFNKWCTLHRKRFTTPSTKRRTKLADLRSWLLIKPEATRHLYAFLPYPEYEAKQWQHQQLEAWGAQEVYREQVNALQRIRDDVNISAPAKDYINEWLHACTDTSVHSDTAQTLARSPKRWSRLEKWVTTSVCRGQPQAMSESE
ncbi:hypothetical protein PF004_g16280 [Phytophthora fragariae]|nr:hypothetical protein PF004_g16280 [Phytophthora fragariae]